MKGCEGLIAQQNGHLVCKPGSGFGTKMILQCSNHIKCYTNLFISIFKLCQAHEGVSLLNFKFFVALRVCVLLLSLCIEIIVIFSHALDFAT